MIASRVNITHSLCIKHQLKLANRIAEGKGFANNINYKKTTPSLIKSVLTDAHILDLIKNEPFNQFNTEIIFCKKI